MLVFAKLTCNSTEVQIVLETLLRHMNVASFIQSSAIYLNVADGVAVKSSYINISVDYLMLNEGETYKEGCALLYN